MLKRKTTVRHRGGHRGGHRVAVAALAVAVAISIVTIVSLTSLGTPTPLEAAGIPHPTTSADTEATAQPHFVGSGDCYLTVTVPDGPNELAVATITHGGSDHFEVTARNWEGDRPENLVNTTGAYSGTVLFNRARNNTTLLHVTADGPWSITLVSQGDLPELRSGVTNGFGDHVAVYLGTAGSATVTDESHGFFQLTGYGASGNIVLNKLGPFQQDVRWPGGPSLIAIHSEGAWSVSVHSN